jgi:hypothetical protein
MTRSPVAATQMPPVPSEREFYEGLIVSLGSIMPHGVPVNHLRHRFRVLGRQRRAVDEKVVFEIVEEQRRLAEGARKSTHERRSAQRRRHRRDFLPEAPAVFAEGRHGVDTTTKGESVQSFEVEEWE